MTTLAFNVLSTIRTAIESEHAIDPEDEKARLSLYYVAGEITASYTGMTIAVPGAAWREYQEFSAKGLGAALLRLASYVDLSRSRTHPRGPKKPVQEGVVPGTYWPQTYSAHWLRQPGAPAEPGRRASGSRTLSTDP